MREKAKVENLMTSPAYSCSPHDNLRTPAEIMWEADCGCVVVTDNQRPVGVITDRDICMAAHLTGAPLDNTRVADVMSPNVCTCRSDATLEEASALMREKQVRRVPVTDSTGRVVGLISLNDLALATQAARTDSVSPAMVGTTLAAISQHRLTPGSSHVH